MRTGTSSELNSSFLIRQTFLTERCRHSASGFGLWFGPGAGVRVSGPGTSQELVRAALGTGDPFSQGLLELAGELMSSLAKSVRPRLT